jgi:hypothetical protein
MAETAVGWMLLEGAAIALAKKKDVPDGHKDAAFYDGKVAAALYYARHVLPSVEHAAKRMAEEDRTPLDISVEAFATV